MQSIARTSKQIGNIFRQTRKRMGFSQKELGERAGLWQETISKIENGADSTRLETLLSILAALDLELTIHERQKISPTDIGDIF